MIPTLQLGGLGRATRIQTGGGGGVTTLNPSDKAGVIVLSNGNLTAGKTGADAWTGVRATTHRTTGKRVFEVRLTSGTMDGFMVGVCTSGASLTAVPSSTAGFYVFHNNTTRATYSNGSNTFTSGSQVSAGGYVMVIVDEVLGYGWVKTSNVAGYIGGGDPGFGTSPCFTFTPGTDVYPFISLNHSNNVADANFVGPFNQTIPLGFVAWDAAAEQGAYADPYWPHVALLISGEGTNGSTTFTDLASRHTISATGSIAVATGDSDFPSGAIDTDGSGSDYLTVSGLQDDWAFLTGPFCVESTFKLDAAASGDGAYFLSTYDGAGPEWALHIMPGSGSVRFLLGSTSVSRTFTFATGTLYHLAASRDASGNFRIFANGTQIGATDTTTFNGVTIGSNANQLVVGVEGPPYTSFGHWNGRQGWLRVTVGVPRYTANFTPESRPYAMA